MPRTIDLPRLRSRATADVDTIEGRYRTAGGHYLFLRWIAKMCAVEIHAVWERYAESRLVAALNHHPAYFLKENTIRGVTRVPAGLAIFLVRAGGRYFDFRSTSELIARGDRLVGKTQNPFRGIPTDTRMYLDTLAAIRNCVVHGSDAAVAGYKRALRSTYGIRSAPGPDEFLHARDFRAASPARYESRLRGLAVVVRAAIHGV